MQPSVLLLPAGVVTNVATVISLPTPIPATVASVFKPVKDSHHSQGFIIHNAGISNQSIQLLLLVFTLSALCCVCALYPEAIPHHLWPTH